jgi:hypothetical protein
MHRTMDRIVLERIGAFSVAKEILECRQNVLTMLSSFPRDRSRRSRHPSGAADAGLPLTGSPPFRRCAAALPPGDEPDRSATEPGQPSRLDPAETTITLPAPTVATETATRFRRKNRPIAAIPAKSCQGQTLLLGRVRWIARQWHTTELSDGHRSIALRFPHTFYVLAALILFFGVAAIAPCRPDIFRKSTFRS